MAGFEPTLGGSFPPGLSSRHRVGGRRCPSAGCSRCPGCSEGNGVRGGVRPPRRWKCIRQGRGLRRALAEKNMASKSAGTKTVAIKSKAAPQKEGETPEKEGPETPDAPLPLLDLSDAAVKKMIKQAKKRGYVTHEQLNSVMPAEEVTSEQIEDVLAMMSEMGINVVETEEAEADEEAREEPEEEETEAGELVEVTPKTPAKSEAKEPAERTDDPVRMYLREMGTVELLSREGEIAIAKRIEAGREAMIAGLCESPLTFQAIIIWRDELNEGKIFLRDIIDLEATYAGPEARGGVNPGIGAEGAAAG